MLRFDRRPVVARRLLDDSDQGMGMEQSGTGPQASQQSGPAAPERVARSLRMWDTLALTVAAALCLALAALALSEPWVSDDFSNALSLDQYPAFGTWVAHWYAAWTGRFSAAAFSWFAMQIRPVYGLIIWVGLMLLVVMTFSVARGRLPRANRDDLPVLALVLLAFWYGMPALEETVFWTSGSMVYLWPAVFALLFLYGYRRWETGEAASRHPAESLRVLGMLALGFWLGGLQEQLWAACLVYLALLGIRVWRTQGPKRIPLRLYAGGVGLLAAGVISLVAPGNGVRLEAVPSQGMTETAIAAAKFLVHTTVEWLPPLLPWLLVLALLGLASGGGRDSEESGERTVGSRVGWSVWMVLATATITPFLIKPYFGAERTIIFAAVFLTVAALSLGNRVPSTVATALPRRAVSATLAFLLLIAACDAGLSAWQARQLLTGQRARAEGIARLKDEGVRAVVVSPITDDPPRRGVIWSDGTGDPGFWLNGILATWYGVDRVIVSGAPGTPPRAE